MKRQGKTSCVRSVPEAWCSLVLLTVCLTLSTGLFAQGSTNTVVPGELELIDACWAGTERLVLSWSAPEADGGSAIGLRGERRRWVADTAEIQLHES